MNAVGAAIRVELLGALPVDIGFGRIPYFFVGNDGSKAETGRVQPVLGLLIGQPKEVRLEKKKSQSNFF